MKKLLLLLVTHGVALVIGFAGGIYALPILTAPPAAEDAAVEAVASTALFTGEFRRDLAGSDMLHWGEGTVVISEDGIAMEGKLAPGPDYKLYLSPAFVETEADFLSLKDQMVQVGDVKNFRRFVLDLPEAVDPADYNSVIIWCESFEEFISAAQYQ